MEVFRQRDHGLTRASIQLEYSIIRALFDNIISMKNPTNSDTRTNLLRYFQLQRRMQMHEKRIRNVQPTLRATREQTNRSCGHIKKQPLAEFNRIVTIDIENKALLKKLTDKSPSRIGREKPYKIVKNNRRKNLEDYNQRLENQGLLKRIKEAKSSYQNGKFASQRKITEAYINTISKFGYKNLAPNKTIMLPFHKRNLSKLFKPETAPESSFYKHHKDSNEVSRIEPEPEADKASIESIETRNMAIPQQKQAKVTYVTWTNKLTIQIDMEFQSMTLEISRSTFRDSFGERVAMVHSAIKYDKEGHSFYIDLEQAS